MENEWLTYQQAAERLGCSPEAIRQKAIRGRWQKTIGNDKRPLIRFPDGWTNAVRTAVERKNSKNERIGRTADERASDTQLIKALEAHVETLKEQLAAAETRDAQHVAQLVAEQAKTEKAIEESKEDRDELRQERDDWRREAEMLCAEMLCAAKLRAADERHVAHPERAHDGVASSDRFRISWMAGKDSSLARESKRAGRAAPNLSPAVTVTFPCYGDGRGRPNPDGLPSF